MAKLVSTLFISLDGVAEIDETWHFPYFDDNMARAVSHDYDGVDTLLLGRVTYDSFAGAWPDREKAGEEDAEFAKFRAIMEEANTAELFEAKGEDLWKAKRGPKGVSLEQCDLGLGPGVLKGAYVQAPRYFADVGKVMDIEARIVHCMVTLQGFRFEDLAKQPFSTEQRTPEIVSTDRSGTLTFTSVSAGQSWAARRRMMSGSRRSQVSQRGVRRLAPWRSGKSSESAIARRPSSVASIAAATVPE